MPARALSTGSLTFGLVSVPIKLYSTNETKEHVGFHWLHEKCGGRVKSQYYCPKDDVVVPRDELVRGYEVSKGKFVQVSAEELAETKVDPRDAVEIVEFVPDGSVSLLLFDRAYYLAPGKGGEKAYALLAESMKRKQRVAIARYAARGQEHVVAIRNDDDLLVMHQLRDVEEVKPASEIPVPHTNVTDKELKLADQLIDSTSVDSFDPKQFHDEVRRRTKALIEKKVERGQVRAPKGEEAAGAATSGKIIDLMAALQASLGQASLRQASLGKASPGKGSGTKKAARRAPARGGTSVNPRRKAASRS